jgi:hypothetical protein
MTRMRSDFESRTGRTTRNRRLSTVMAGTSRVHRRSVFDCLVHTGAWRPCRLIGCAHLRIFEISVDAVEGAPSLFHILRRRSIDGVDGKLRSSQLAVDGELRRRTTPSFSFRPICPVLSDGAPSTPSTPSQKEAQCAQPSFSVTLKYLRRRKLDRRSIDKISGVHNLSGDSPSNFNVSHGPGVMHHLALA